MATQARARQQLRRTLKEIAAVRTSCSHWNAEATGPTEACQSGGRWIYRIPYRCPDCLHHFVESHEQTAARSLGDAVV
jgi:predicted amidophosphoribosyltransferase